MGKRQVVTIDITWGDNYSEITATDLIKMLINMQYTIKSVNIQVINKQKKKNEEEE